MVHKVEDGGPLVDDGHFDAEGGEKGAELQPHDARAHDDGLARQSRKQRELVRIDDARSIKRNLRAARRARAAGDEDVAGAHAGLSILAFYFQRVGIEEARGAVEDSDVVALELRADDLRLPFHDGADAKSKVLNRDVVLQRVIASVESPLSKAGEMQSSFAQSLAGYRAGVHADAANHTAAVHQRHALAHFRRANSALLPRRTAADDHQVEI